MVIKREGSRTVLAAAKKRIVNAFSNGKKVYISFSGGKDSLCLLDMALKLAAEKKIDPALMVVEFIDEEAIYSCVEKIVLAWRKKVLLAGGQFNWFCIEVRHFNCFNQLESDESFILWDSEKKDVWVRKPPRFAIRTHPQVKARKDTYQEFLMKHNSDGICLTGVRMAESVQRSGYMAASFSSKKGLAKRNRVWPIYDWKDTDVWLYLYENKIDIPDAYLYLYQTGSRLNELRISAFSSVDAAKSIVKMNEYYPDLMDRIIRREPNAYLAALYWDSEMFRRTTKNRKNLEGERDYRAEVFKLLKNPRQNFVTQGSLENAQRIIRLLMKYDTMLSKKGKVYKTIYNCLVGGDPKMRTLRGIMTTINSEYFWEHTKGKRHEKRKS